MDTAELLRLAHAAVVTHLPRFPVETTWQSKQYPGEYDVVIDTCQQAWGIAWQVAVYGRVAGHLEEMCVCWCLDGGVPQVRTHAVLGTVYPAVVAALGAVLHGGMPVQAKLLNGKKGK